MKNFNKWRTYMDKVVSPQSYIDFGYYYLISAALQRRVWCPPDHARVYANMFVILVGEPGLGKGVVIKPVSEILRHYKLPNPSVNGAAKPEGLTEEQLVIKKAVEESNYELASGEQMKFDAKKGEIQNKEEPLLIPMAADATTFEALIRALAKSIRKQDYTAYDEKLQKNVIKIYTHSSLCFSLEEISSLFRKKSEDVVKLLLNGYDCGDYTYDTKTQGRDGIKRCCLNFLGGTTPGFIRNVFDDKILDDGFSSRTFFLFESKNRKKNFFIPELTADQYQCKQDIIKHVGEVLKLYGPVIIEPTDRQWLEDWIQTEERSRSNTSGKLSGYYSRKNLHIIKLGMAIHFGESLDMHIPRSAFERAMEVLAVQEKKMHYALDFNGKNPLFDCAKKCTRYLVQNGARTRKELLVELFPDLPNGAASLDEVLEYLTTTTQISMVSKPNSVGTLVNQYEICQEKVAIA